MTPRDYALLAQRAYTTLPLIGLEASAARAITEGNAVAFPGTNNGACWRTDVEVAITRVEGLGYLHAGFWQALCSIVGPLLALPCVDVTVGHSEGAALALLHAALLCQIGRPPREVYAFEPPRVSVDGTIAALLQARGVQLHLYRNGLDIVPLVPPSLVHTWQHPAPLIAIGKPSLPVPNVADHSIDRVIAAL
ncbi:lipase [Paraburkholderia sp. LEh10]|jgi:hypothetical protein|uniref:lipase family protein n=1 Tax=Paraburkholderia sp. LEh10 TaxID=2821353 RepID=UPI001AE923A8|nr:lipase [Paraburkholderia sp. LEh10]MBP0589197.1 lipase [Paraburkholderia sp. LEh10]